ncbi:DUF1697 domain-containing protein [Cellulomonas sp. PhB143]|uniref:DUF1697 domain-containing protein n=1 Tax=Cellulomonas sp. PhB143 TaxID=2485186 RepID=UPI000F4726A9|nr:DUF1697 domain-containing protein [Cellulomonas sp. PhB143]ROS76894.1 uncharacterized protein (DUF1697 family) [Cellulomonas sp. PhB143]
MSRVAVLLRAVNVGGVKVSSAQLRETASALGLGDPVTHLATGNLVVAPGTSGARDADDVARLVAQALTDLVGREVQTTARTHAQLAGLVGANPFAEAARDDPSHLVVLFHPVLTTHAAGPVDLTGTTGVVHEELVTAGAHTYAWFPDGIGTSGLTAARLARVLGTWGTGRNWNTVARLVELTGGG